MMEAESIDCTKNINEYEQVQIIPTETHQFHIYINKRSIRKRYKMAEIMQGVRYEYELSTPTNTYIFKKEIKIEILRTPMISKGTYENMLLNQLGKIDLLIKKSDDKDYPCSLMKYLHIFYKEENYMFYVISEYFESALPLELRNVEPLVLFTYVSSQLLDAFEYLTKIGIFTSFLTILINEENDIKIWDFGLIHALNEVNNEYNIESNICIDYPKDYLSLDDHYSLTLSEEQQKIYEKKEEVYYPWIYALIMINKATQQMLKEECSFEIRGSEGEYWHEASLLLRCFILNNDENEVDYSKSYKSQAYKIKELLEKFENKPSNEIKKGKREEEINIRLLKAQATDFKDYKNKLEPWLKKSLEFFEKKVLKPYKYRSKLSEIREFFHNNENWIITETINKYYEYFNIEHENAEKEQPTNLIDELRYFIDYDICSKIKAVSLYQMVAISMDSAELRNENEFKVIQNSIKTISSTEKLRIANVLKIYKNFQYEKKMIQFACYASQFRLLIKMSKRVNQKLQIGEQKWKEEQKLKSKQNEKDKESWEKDYKEKMNDMSMFREKIWKKIKEVFLILKEINERINGSNLETFFEIETFSQLRDEIKEFVKLIEGILEQVNEKYKQSKDEEQVGFQQKIESISNDQLFNIKRYAKCVFVDFAHFFNIKTDVLHSVLHSIQLQKEIILQNIPEQEIRILLSCVDNLTSDLMAGIFGILVYDYSTSSSSPPKVKLNSLKLLTLIEVIINQNRGFQCQVQELSHEPFIEKILINLSIKKYIKGKLYHKRFKRYKATEDTEDMNDTGEHDDKNEANDSVY